MNAIAGHAVDSFTNDVACGSVCLLFQPLEKPYFFSVQAYLESSGSRRLIEWVAAPGHKGIGDLFQ